VKNVKSGPAGTAATAALAELRLHRQGIAGARFDTPEDVVRALGAVQSQDYNAALWALGLRLKSASFDQVEAAFARRTIVRTWPMRGTLHTVPAQDARWMLELMTPRVIRASASRYRQLELDDKVLAKSAKLTLKALEGGKHVTRPGFYKVLERGGVATAGSRGLHILGYLAQKQLICFGARAGKQQTIVLFDEWVPNSRQVDQEEALGMLARNYFTGHGPATIQDLAWWAGLTVADVKKGLESIKPELEHLTVGERTYWLARDATAGPIGEAYLLPVYDEYLVAYRDRTAALDPAHKLDPGDSILKPAIVVDGRIAGTWTRTMKKDKLVVALKTFVPVSAAKRPLLANAAERLGRFVGLAVEPVW
jgi:DNA glycosylase AlkZ-like